MKKGAIFLFCALLLAGCSKNDGSRIPNVPVNFRESLLHPSLSRLNSPGGAVIINGHGVAGLILYRTQNEYVAYDRCSSVNPERKCAVTLDEGNFTATDPCSGAVFSLFDGTPMKAPAKRPLKEYQVNIINSQISVTN